MGIIGKMAVFKFPLTLILPKWLSSPKKLSNIAFVGHKLSFAAQEEHINLRGSNFYWFGKRLLFFKQKNRLV